jgi:hypothetical protein
MLTNLQTSTGQMRSCKSLLPGVQFKRRLVRDRGFQADLDLLVRAAAAANRKNMGRMRGGHRHRTTLKSLLTKVGAMLVFGLLITRPSEGSFSLCK